MTPDQIKIWNEIVQSCNAGLSSVNVGTQRRAEVIIAVNRELQAANIMSQKQALECRNPHPPCCLNVTFGVLGCSNCDWSE